MNSNSNFNAKGNASVERGRGLGSGFAPKGRFKIEHWRDGKLLQTQDVPNGVTTVGLEKILDVYFHDGSATAASGWYIGLITGESPALAASDTIASKGWTENTSYDEATRIAWGPDDPLSNGGVITNGTSADFTISATVVIGGAFLINFATKGDVVSGDLWATATFASKIDLIDNDKLKVTYTITAS
jgi:hypothetical protein